MPLLRFVYDNRKEFIATRGNKTYHFDPICQVDDPVDLAEFLSLKPETFRIVQVSQPGLLECPFCDFTTEKGAKSLNMHVYSKHKRDYRDITGTQKSRKKRDKRPRKKRGSNRSAKVDKDTDN